MVISGNQQFLRSINQIAVLRAVRMHPGTSRVGLANLLRLTRPTIGNVVDDLLKGGWLAEEHLGPTGQLGRRPVALHVDNGNRVIIGGDINNFRIICAAVTLSGEIRELSIKPAPSGNVEDVLALLAQQIVGICQRLDVVGSRVTGIGIGVPGPVDPETGALRYSESTGWNNIPMKDSLQALLTSYGMTGVPVTIERAADCVALYQFEFRRLAEEEPLLYVHTGQAVTSSVASRYNLLRGHAGTMGSIGHIILDPDGPPCPCGRRGCANVTATLQAVQNATGCPIDKIRSATQAGDQAVIRELSRAGHHFGLLLQNLCMLFDPARLLVGGMAFQSGPEFANSARETFQHLMSSSAEATCIPLEIVRHEPNAVALGAATSVLYSQLRLT